MIQPATIKLYLPFGDPTRLRTAELSNWSGKALAAPRSDLAELFDRRELDQSGIYVLTGIDAKRGDPVAYIGEAEVLRTRLKQHSSKDYWNQLVLFISKDENLTKAHVRYLEGVLISEALDVGRSRVLNAQGSGSRLPESDRADMDVYLAKVRQLLPVLGSPLLSKPPSRSSADSTHLFATTIRGLEATGKLSSGGFTVFTGSQAVETDRDSASQSVRNQRAELVQRELLVMDGDHYVFSDDVEFSSPSMAASVVKGGNTNGLTSWKLADGTSLKDLERRSAESKAGE